MWKIESQRYDQLVWQCKEENKLKSELLDKMNISVRMLCSIKKEKSVTVNGKYVPLHTMV